MNNESKEFEVRDDAMVIDTNPEMADMSNPRGEIYGVVYYVVETDSEGNRRRHRCQSIVSDFGKRELTEYSKEQLEALAEKLNREQPELNDEYWFSIEPACGSPAYQDQEPMMAYREQQDALWEEAQGKF